MESLLRLSGLLGDDDDGSTDLGTLEKRLAEKNGGVSVPTGAASSRHSAASSLGPEKENEASISGSPGPQPTDTPITSPGDPPKSAARSEEEVEALSDMMCSLVTNNCGETRYIGMTAVGYQGGSI